MTTDSDRSVSERALVGSRVPSGQPLVSIGMPIFNEARFLDASLRSLRKQDYPNLEIVISDNGSTDRTVEICEFHAAEDARIRIVRSTVNHGVNANFERSLEMAQGEYFMWAAGHDLWTPNLISECVALLDSIPGAVLAFGSSRWIGAEGQPLPRSSGWTDTRGLSPIARLFTIFWGNMHPVVGLIRTTQLRACLPLVNVTGGDLVLLADLALRGDFLHAPLAMWSRREFRVELTYEEKLKRYASTTVGISKSRLQRMFPLLHLPLALVRVVMRSRLPRLDKLAIVTALIVSFPLRRLDGRRGHAR
jgi:glycosyltransferase involved in cell wall biosynthesis